MFPILGYREKGLLVTLEQANAAFFELAKQFAGQSKEDTAVLWRQAEAQLTTGPAVYTRCGQDVRLFLHEAEEAETDGLFVGHRLSIYTHGDGFLFKIRHHYTEGAEIPVGAALGLERAVEWFSLKFSLPCLDEWTYHFNYWGLLHALEDLGLEWVPSVGEEYESPIAQLRALDRSSGPQFVRASEGLQVTVDVCAQNRWWIDPGSTSLRAPLDRSATPEEPSVMVWVARANEDPSPFPLLLDSETRKLAACTLNAQLARPLSAALAL
ncbi:MAG TPA: hypothetical protein VFO38_01645 [Candidatus Saccharimonadales bacterium]|nr:hypothetical protein [Candidatus Saccharimonadales bacterium]